MWAAGQQPCTPPPPPHFQARGRRNRRQGLGSSGIKGSRSHRTWDRPSQGFKNPNLRISRPRKQNENLESEIITTTAIYQTQLSTYHRSFLALASSAAFYRRQTQRGGLPQRRVRVTARVPDPRGTGKGPDLLVTSGQPQGWLNSVS